MARSPFPAFPFDGPISTPLSTSPFEIPAGTGLAPRRLHHGDVRHHAPAAPTVPRLVEARQAGGGGSGGWKEPRATHQRMDRLNRRANPNFKLSRAHTHASTLQIKSSRLASCGPLRALAGGLRLRRAGGPPGHGAPPGAPPRCAQVGWRLALLC